MTLAPLVLIGPYLSGKTTIRHLLAATLHRPHLGLVPWHDEAVVLDLFQSGGWDPAEEARVLATGTDHHAYLRPFAVHAIEQAIGAYSDYIIELAADWPVQTDPMLFQRVQQAVARCRQVILLLPSSDPGTSYSVLRQRYWNFIDIDLNDIFVRHPSNHRLAKHIVYTEGKAPPETCAEVLARIAHAEHPTMPIILIGPPAIGKSTISRLLAAQLDLPLYALDAREHMYPPELGYDADHVAQLFQTQGIRGVWRYEQPFLAAHLDQIIRDHQDGIIDFGAGHSVFENDIHLAQVERILAPHPNVVLLLPSPDLDESIRILKERPRTTIDGIDANRYLIEHPAYARLATIVAYTEGQTPEETCRVIIERLYQ
jgi:shikimate kinase